MMMVAAIVAGSGVLVCLLGVTIWRGRTDLHALYPTRNGPTELAARAGGCLTAYGVVTIAVAGVIAWRGSLALLWGTWTFLTLLVSVGVAALANSYT